MFEVRGLFACNLLTPAYALPIQSLCIQNAMRKSIAEPNKAKWLSLK